MKVMVISDINFNTFERAIQIKAGQFIFVDMSRKIAYFEGIKFDITPNEYCLPN